MSRALGVLLLCSVLGCEHGPYLIGDEVPPADSGALPSALNAEQCVLATTADATRYYTCAHTRTWNSAQATCVAAGGNLTSIADATLEAALAASVTGEAWIGLYTALDTRVFQWVDGAPSGYEAFRPSEPDNLGGNETCAALASHDDAGDPGWDDRDCVVDLPYICEVPE